MGGLGGGSGPWLLFCVSVVFFPGIDPAQSWWSKVAAPETLDSVYSFSGAAVIKYCKLSG